MRYWKRVDSQNKTTTVESYSHDLVVLEAIEIGKAEFDDYIVNLPVPIPVIPRDIIKEFDSLKTELKSKGLIT